METDIKISEEVAIVCGKIEQIEKHLDNIESALDSKLTTNPDECDPQDLIVRVYLFNLRDNLLLVKRNAITVKKYKNTIESLNNEEK